jgi:hypothetical protein
MSIAPRTPVECLSTILLWLSGAVDAHCRNGRLAAPLMMLIMNKIRGIKQRFADLAARITAGKFFSRHRPAATQRQHTERRPPPPNPLQGFAWMIKLVPGTAVYGSQLQYLLAEPEMAALVAAAPTAMGRPLRSLCWMLGISPPPILTAPARPRPPRPKTAEPKTPKPPDSRPRTRLGFYKGPPPMLASIADRPGPARKTARKISG